MTNTIILTANIAIIIYYSDELWSSSSGVRCLYLDAMALGKLAGIRAAAQELRV